MVHYPNPQGNIVACWGSKAESYMSTAMCFFNTSFIRPGLVERQKGAQTKNIAKHLRPGKAVNNHTHITCWTQPARQNNHSTARHTNPQRSTSVGVPSKSPPEAGTLHVPNLAQQNLHSLDSQTTDLTTKPSAQCSNCYASPHVDGTSALNLINGDCHSIRTFHVDQPTRIPEPIQSRNKI